MAHLASRVFARLRRRLFRVDGFESSMMPPARHAVNVASQLSAAPRAHAKICTRSRPSYMVARCAGQALTGPSRARCVWLAVSGSRARHAQQQQQRQQRPAPAPKNERQHDTPIMAAALSCYSRASGRPARPDTPPRHSGHRRAPMFDKLISVLYGRRHCGRGCLCSGASLAQPPPPSGADRGQPAAAAATKSSRVRIWERRARGLRDH